MIFTSIDALPKICLRISCSVSCTDCQYKSLGLSRYTLILSLAEVTVTLVTVA